MQRLSLRVDHMNITAGLRRAYHELAMAHMDLKVAESRRVSADVQCEAAVRGALVYVEEDYAI